jgi:hypothetical protein
MRRMWLLPFLLLTALPLLFGCGGADQGAGVARAAAGYEESLKAGDLTLTLAVSPARTGENRFTVVTSRPDVKAVEAQVVMATMGHGAVVDLVPQGDGRFTNTSPVIDMAGRWMVRVKATLPDGQQRDATFYFQVQ